MPCMTGSVQRTTCPASAVCDERLLNWNFVNWARFEKPTYGEQLIFGTLTQRVTGMGISSSVLTISDPLSCQLFLLSQHAAVYLPQYKLLIFQPCYRSAKNKSRLNGFKSLLLATFETEMVVLRFIWILADSQTSVLHQIKK